MGGAAVPLAGGFGVNEGRAVWFIRTIVGDEDGVAFAVGEGVTSVANVDLVSELLAAVSSALRLRDALRCEPSVVARAASTVAEAVAVAACNWLTSME